MVGTSDYILDGAAMSDPLDGAGTLVRPPGLDTIQEFNVSVNATSAKFARPTNVVISTRSGSNQFHGTLFETNRNNAYGVARIKGQHDGRQASRTLTAMSTAGRPAARSGSPVLYNGKDQTFWFFSFEQMKLRNPSSEPAGCRPWRCARGLQRVEGQPGSALTRSTIPWTTNPRHLAAPAGHV